MYNYIMYSIIQIMYNYNYMCIITIMYNYPIKITLISETHISATISNTTFFIGKGKSILNFSRLLSMHCIHCFSNRK